ncbi:Proton Channel Otop1 [Manis pentadactyla]|nr:Proton Channel Otop1 [Manis pentadactyla]
MKEIIDDDNLKIPKRLTRKKNHSFCLGECSQLDSPSGTFAALRDRAPRGKSTPPAANSKILLVLLWRNTISSSPCESPSLARLRHLDLAVHPRCWALSQAVLGGSRCSPPWWRPKPDGPVLFENISNFPSPSKKRL